MKEFIALTDILDKVTASDSECDVLSSGDELDDEGELWKLDVDNEILRHDGVEDDDGSDDDNGGDGGDDKSDDGDHDEPLAN